MLALVSGAMVLLLLLRPFYGTWRRGAVAASAILFYLLYEPSLLFWLEPSNGLSVAIFAGATLLLLIVLLRLWRSPTRAAGLTLALNAIVLVAPLPDIWQLANWAAETRSATVAASEVFPDLPLPAVAGMRDEDQPDIWYLVPDRYSNEAILRGSFGFDNGPFLATLRDKGFTVVDNAHANYQRTAVSMASTLNLDYLDPLYQYPEIDGRDWRPLYRTLTDNRVSRFLDRLGYRIYRLGSHWEPTRRDPYADAHFNVFDMPEFGQRLLTVTVPGQLAYATGFGAIDGWHAHCQRLQRQFDDLVALAGRDERKYVLAHLLITHPPFVMDDRGNCLARAQASARPGGQPYVDSVKVANTQFTRLIDAIQAGPRPAVIVLMADEGPWPPSMTLLKPATFASSEMVDWTTLSPEQLDLKMGILMAVHLPKTLPSNAATDDPLPPSPVNVFRMIFRRYFDMPLPPLKDRHFIYRSDESIYDFIDVTDRLPK
ncbi:MAG: hypothetical protein IPK59_14750 [Rhodospirillaceae bacterium]|nr:hypothetical protein [Rhodospirillaceae bacterium]